MPFYSSQSFSESRLFSPSLMQSRQPIQPSLPSLLHSGLPPPEITGRHINIGQGIIFNPFVIIVFE